MRRLAALALALVLGSPPALGDPPAAAVLVDLPRADIERALVISDLDRRKCEAVLEVVTSSATATVEPMPWWGWVLSIVAGTAAGVSLYLGGEALVDQVSR